MVRILGNNLSNKKKVYIALTCIYGIGISTSKKLLIQLNIDPNVKVSDLTEGNVSALRDYLETEEFKLEAIKNNADSIHFVKNPSEELQLLAVSKKGYVISYIENPKIIFENAVFFVYSISFKLLLTNIYY
jgi:ribosomal protein S13